MWNGNKAICRLLACVWLCKKSPSPPHAMCVCDHVSSSQMCVRYYVQNQTDWQSLISRNHQTAATPLWKMKMWKVSTKCNSWYIQRLKKSPILNYLRQIKGQKTSGILPNFGSSLEISAVLFFVFFQWTTADLHQWVPLIIINVTWGNHFWTKAQKTHSKQVHDNWQVAHNLLTEEFCLIAFHLGLLSLVGCETLCCHPSVQLEEMDSEMFLAVKAVCCHWLKWVCFGLLFLFKCLAVTVSNVNNVLTIQWAYEKS